MGNSTIGALDLRYLLGKDNYIIPIYQRNYAWGKTEIAQLIRDIKDFFENKNEAPANYYIGSLVCFKRENGDFELIDGQQRHTTLSLINAVLKTWKIGKEGIEGTVSRTNLKFDSRKNVQYFLEGLYSAADINQFMGKSSGPEAQSFMDAIGFIKEEFNETSFDVAKFAEHFYRDVKFFRVEVPLDTDLNHYFEIMNNRGEQLEKHEIIKALLMGNGLDKSEQELFAMVWDACSDMSAYIYFNFDSENRKKLFTEGCVTITEFDQVRECIKTKNKNNEDEESLSDILKADYLSENFNKGEVRTNEKYKSVIDFPNFLLQVLKLDDNEVSLDDKNLLKAFEKKIDPKKFIIDLLKYRAVFDKYIIKQDLSDSDEEKQNWSIRMPNEIFDGVVRTYQESGDELIKLQTMLYYSNSSNTNNNWVQDILRKEYFAGDVELFTNNVFSEIAWPRFDGDNLVYPHVTAYNLYFIDLLLWKLYKTEDEIDELTALKNKIENVKKHFSTFKFRQLNSKEHLFPQARAEDFGIGYDDLNDIGNLCLISTSQNSSGNEGLPIAKKKRFENDNSSLKRLIMFESFDENDNWNSKKMQNHTREINDLIQYYYNEKTHF